MGDIRSRHKPGELIAAQIFRLSPSVMEGEARGRIVPGWRQVFRSSPQGCDKTLAR